MKNQVFCIFQEVSTHILLGSHTLEIYRRVVATGSIQGVEDSKPDLRLCVE